MAQTVLFRIRGDSSGFSKAITGATGSLSKLKGSLGKASGGAKGFKGSLGRMRDSLISTAAEVLTLQTNMIGLQGLFKVGSAVKGAVVSFASFEQGMIKIQAVTDMAEEEMAAMKTLINDLAIETKFTSKEVSEAAYNLATLGVKGVDAFTQLLPVVTKTAIAMDRGVTPTSDVLLKTMKQFKVEMKDAGSVADVMVNAYTKSSLNLEKFAYSMEYAGPTAQLLGESLEDTVGLLALLADRGIKASAAGTGLRAAMTDLATNSQVNCKILEGYGLTLADIDPETHKFIDVLKTLEEAGVASGDMFALLGKRAGPVTQMLIKLGDGSETSTEKMQKLSAEMGKVGTMTGIATKMEEGLQFAFTQSAASISLFSIATGEGIADLLKLKEMAYSVTEIFGNLTKVISKLDFGALKTEGFNPEGLTSSFKVVFSEVLPALSELFRVSAGIGALYLLEKLALGLPLVITKGIPIILSAFVSVVGAGAKLFVTLIVEGFNLVMASLGVFINHLLGDMLEIIGDLASVLKLNAMAASYWGAALTRQTVTAKDLTGFIDTDKIKDSAHDLIDAASKLSIEGVTLLSEKAGEYVEPHAKKTASSYQKQREELMESFSPAVENLTQAVKEVPIVKAATKTIDQTLTQDQISAKEQKEVRSITSDFMTEQKQMDMPATSKKAIGKITEQIPKMTEKTFTDLINQVPTKEEVKALNKKFRLLRKQFITLSAEMSVEEARLLQKKIDKAQSDYIDANCLLEAFETQKAQKAKELALQAKLQALSPQQDIYSVDDSEGTYVREGYLSKAEDAGTYMREKPQLTQVTDNRIQHLYGQDSRLEQLAGHGDINPRGDKEN